MKINDSMKIPFAHRQWAHCETGVMSNMLRHHGLEISEALVFGIGSGLFFGHFPFIRLNHLPLTAFRISTGGIMRRVAKRLDVNIRWQKFHDPQKAMEALDQKIAQNIPVGCLTGAYWLDYFPDRYRFHFNMHNVVAFGKKGDGYLISDPVFPEPVVCHRKSFIKARFARGLMPPKGKMFYVANVPEEINFPRAVVKGIKEVCRTMLTTPVPFVGVKGIRYLAKKVENWPEKLGKRKAAHNLGQLIRMQEEIGTGGAGFRFIYAAFLQECADILGKRQLVHISERITEIGDRWRDFALMGSRICKNRGAQTETYPTMANILLECAAEEEKLLRDLSKIVH